MTLHVERLGDRLVIVLPPEQIEAMSLQEGSAVDVRSVEPEATQYMTLEEGLAAFERTEPRFAEVYRALAK